jgi:hypothetical protein
MNFLATKVRLNPRGHTWGDIQNEIAKLNERRQFWPASLMKMEGDSYGFLLDSLDYRYPFCTGGFPDQWKFYDAFASRDSDPFILADHARDNGSQCIC